MSVSTSLGFRAQPRTLFSLNLSFYKCQGFGLSINTGTTDQNLDLPEWLECLLFGSYYLKGL